ncbi:MAG: hypothetical protein RI894_1732 [Bacteroidota bacterium]|jgi:hypothetical protein
MNNEEQTNPFFSIEQLRKSPLSQAAAVFLLCVCTCLGGRLFSAMGFGAVSPYFYWLLCTSFLLVFIILNTTQGTRSNDILNYAKQSLYGFVGLLMATNYLAKLASGVAIRDSNGFAWLYVVLIVCYITFFCITLILKQLWDFFEAESKEKLKKDGLD